MTTIQLNDTIKFRYAGGSDYNGWREVKVTEVTSRSVGGVDLEANSFKKYLRSKMSNITSVPVLNATMAEEQRDLEKLLKSHAEYVVVLVPKFNARWGVDYQYDVPTKRLIERPRKSVGQFVLEKTVGGVSLTLNNPNGKVVRLKFENGYSFLNNSYAGSSTICEELKKLVQ